MTQRVLVHFYFAAEAWTDAKFHSNQHTNNTHLNGIFGDFIPYVRREKSVIEYIENIQGVSEIAWEIKELILHNKTKQKVYLNTRLEIIRFRV